MITYIPTLPGNALYLALFALMLAAQVVLGIYYRFWSYLVAISCGLILEVLGYVGRLQLHNNPFDFDAFLLYLIPLTIGPAFFSAAIYICFGRIVLIYDACVSRLKPRAYTGIFVACDVVCLILQAAGGAITSVADDDQRSLRDTGVNIMIAGLAAQVASLAAFMGLCADYMWRLRRASRGGDRMTLGRDRVRDTLTWKCFLWGLAIATIGIFIRSIFRVAELQGGFDSKLANAEIPFMILEGAVMTVSCGCLTVFHPRFCFRRWKNGDEEGKSVDNGMEIGMLSVTRNK